MNFGQTRTKVEVILHDAFYSKFEINDLEEYYDACADDAVQRVMQIVEELEKDTQDEVWNIVENHRYDGEGIS